MKGKIHGKVVIKVGDSRSLTSDERIMRGAGSRF